MGDYSDAFMRNNAAVQAKTKAQNRANVLQLKLIGQSHPTGLTTNLLKLFEPRPPLDFKPPPEKRKCPPLTGIAQYVSNFAEPGDPQYTAPVEKGETPAQRRARIHQLRLEKGAAKAAEELEKYDPNSDPNISGDPYKTLFVARLNYETTESRLKREFDAYGPIKRVRLVTDKESNKPRGYAFIEYMHTRDMKAAYKQADGKKIEGRRVLVDVERGRTVPNWRPRRLGGGLGTTRVGGEEVNQRHSGREQAQSGGPSRSEEPRVREERHVDLDREKSRERGKEKEKEREKSRERSQERSHDKPRERDHREDRHHRDRDRTRDRDRERERDSRRDRDRGKGWSRFVKEKKLDAGDIVSFQRGLGESGKDRLYIDWRRRPEAADPNHHHHALHHQHHNFGIPPPHHYSFHRSVPWSPLLMRPPGSSPTIAREHHLQQMNYSTNIHPYRNSSAGGSGGYGYGNVVNMNPVCSGPVYYLRSGGGGGSVIPQQLHQQEGSATTHAHHHHHHHQVGLGQLGRVNVVEPMVLESVPVVHGKVAAAGKRLRLFGVNMDCPVSDQSDECDILSSSTTTAMVLSQQPHQPPLQLRLYDGKPATTTDFFNRGKTSSSSSMSLDFDV